MIKTVTYNEDKQLSPHFWLHEFKCKESDIIKYSEETIALQEKIFAICSNVSKAIITSGYRSPEYSVKVGGSKNDGHTVGIAVDVKWYDKNNKLIAPKYIACAAQDIGFTGIGIMKNSIHLDTRTTENYKNGKWWGDETNGNNNIEDFYAYFGLSRDEVDKVLGRTAKAETPKTEEPERESVPETPAPIESNVPNDAAVEDTAEAFIKDNANVIVKFFTMIVELIKKIINYKGE